ncbi:LuxR family transcriptional regulator [Saccharothrix sp. ALI-22-I]|uniref:ATP-binding protein n=1 Tax=Saccharothrix sp. ALI-22-I TaxID=1933778 RepID=UPI00097BE63F|nr:LuxR C-terminal-related transcriptional regulator [Saccharothrix sp. ALI-22-I]ONI92624.1 LuxR family transcriptional regulator [Saccharothrix sp. ALI-22-I]
MVAKPPLGNLPDDVSSFVGRTHEVATAGQLLSGTRLLTLTGPGGVGKTRLALRIAAKVRRAFRDGAWLVELAPLEDPDLLVQSVATTLGIRDWSSRPTLDVLLDYLADKHILLVLDNCEHLIEACADLVQTLLGMAPELRVLATSRQSLRTSGEQLMFVPPLSLPDPDHMPQPNELDRYEAINLLSQRAAVVAPGFAITSDTISPVVRLCRRLDGIPLAIELAAVRLRTLSIEQLLSGLEHRFSLLAGGSRTTLSRHQTLQETVDWSFDLCPPDEQRLWARTSVFAGEFDLDAAESVCSGDGIAIEDVVVLVEDLVDKSILVRSDPPHSQHARYHMLDTLRRYGQEKLRAAGEERRMRQRHCEWYQRLAEQAAAEWFGPNQVQWVTRLRSEHTNLRAAIEFCLAERTEVQAGLRIAGALWCYWMPCGVLAEGRQWIDRLLPLDHEPTRARGNALWVYSWAASHQGEPAASDASAEQCRRVAEQLADSQMAAYGLQVAGLSALSSGDLAGARSFCAEAWRSHRALGQLASPAVMALMQQGFVAGLQGDFDQAVAYAQECVRIAKEHGEDWTRSWGLVVLGLALWLRGDHQQAIPPLRESTATKRTLHDLFGLGMAVEFLAWSLTSTGRHEDAARLFGTLERIWPLVGVPLMGIEPLAEYHRENEAKVRAALGEAAFDNACKKVAGLDPYQALDQVLGDKATRREPSPKRDDQMWSPLTRRERDVALLIAEGLSNKDIAARLLIGQRTVESHAEHILSKLGVTSRSHVAVWVAERQATH